MADRPWTAVARDNSKEKYTSVVFNGAYDKSSAAVDFKKKYGQHSLIALIPGDHRNVYIESKIDTHNIATLWQHDHGVS